MLGVTLNLHPCLECGGTWGNSDLTCGETGLSATTCAGSREAAAGGGAILTTGLIEWNVFDWNL